MTDDLTEVDTTEVAQLSANLMSDMDAETTADAESGQPVFPPVLDRLRTCD